MNKTKQKVLITGGGSGIGLSIARKFMDHGHTVIITSRNLSRLAHDADLKDDNLKPMPPEKLANIFWKDFISGKEEITPGLSKQLKLMGRLAPKFIFNQLNKQPVPNK
jgi:short-subunit dehydrogenase